MVLPPLNVAQAGGTIAVILATGLDLPKDYAYHPQVVSLNAADLSPDIDAIGSRVPTTAKLVVIGGHLTQPLYESVKAFAERRNLSFVQRSNVEAVREQLARALPPPPKPNGNGHAPTAQKVGAITAFVTAEADLSKGSAEEGRRLMRLAQERGIITTVATLAQTVSNLKRKRGLTETPRSLMSAEQNALKTLDEAIAGLTLIREFVADTERKNAELSQKLDKVRQLL